MSYSQMSRNENGEDDEDDNPSEFPDGKLNRVWYILKLPLLALLYVTIPDCRKVSVFVGSFCTGFVWLLEIRDPLPCVHEHNFMWR